DQESRRLRRLKKNAPRVSARGKPLSEEKRRNIGGLATPADVLTSARSVPVVRSIHFKHLDECGCTVAARELRFGARRHQNRDCARYLFFPRIGLKKASIRSRSASTSSPGSRSGPRRTVFNP